MRLFAALIILVTVLLGGNATLSANTYVIDGNLSDWHVDLGAASSAGYLDSHLPSGGIDIDVITEDNVDASMYSPYVGPGYSYQNLFDAEAMYVDNDADNLYIAIVTGLPRAGSDVPWNSTWFLPGDIGINTNPLVDSTYEYAIDVSSYDGVNATAKLYNNASWNPVYYSAYAAANPWTINPGSLSSTYVDFVYGYVQNTHYVLEAKIPLASLGLASAGSGSAVRSLDIHWTMQCGNDTLNLRADVNPVAPEPGTMVLLLVGLASGAGRVCLRKKNG